MLDRVDFGARFAAGEIPGIRGAGPALGRAVRAADPDPVRGLVRVLLPASDVDAVAEDIRQAMELGTGGGPEELLALVLASPAYQRH
jgi:hypothetical protein